MPSCKQARNLSGNRCFYSILCLRVIILFWALLIQPQHFYGFTSLENTLIAHNKLVVQLADTSTTSSASWVKSFNELDWRTFLCIQHIFSLKLLYTTHKSAFLLWKQKVINDIARKMTRWQSRKVSRYRTVEKCEVLKGKQIKHLNLMNLCCIGNIGIAADMQAMF